MKKLASFLYSVLGGACIGIGGFAFLSVESKVAGAFLFAVGLFTICVNGFNLFTGKVCYTFDNKLSEYVPFLGSVWLGNLIGAGGMGLLLRLTRFSSLGARAAAISAGKLGDGLVSVFILAVLCGVMIFIAVDAFKGCPHEVGKYLALILGVMVFILCGFEHCVANMFYFTAGAAWSGKALLYLVVMSLGNWVGGVLLPLCRMLKNRGAR